VLLLTATAFSGAGQVLTINSGSRLNLNSLLLSVSGALTVDGTLRTTGGDLAVGSKVISITSSTIELAGNNAITLDTALTASFFNLTLTASKTLSMSAGVLFTIYGDIAPGTADRSNSNATPGRGQCTLKSTIENVVWKLNLVGISTLGAAIDIKDCDARYGHFVSAPGSIYINSFLCVVGGNFRVIQSSRRDNALYRLFN
jgi:hypothetical protein